MIHEEIFENIDKVVDYLVDLGWTLSKTYFGNAPYEVIDYGDNKIVYYPQPLGAPLFRGQNEFYEPCVPSFYRGNPDQITQFTQNLKIEEFRIVTSKHPVIKEELDNGIFYDYVALAQHYEFRTELLDITNSLPVAAFFAVTQQVTGKYQPINRSDKPGVLYFIPPSLELWPVLSEKQPVIHPVGWQVFKRPGEQRAFVINLKTEKDFNSIPGVFAYRFWHDKNISEKIYHLFHGGEDLFPKDIFAEKAASIKDSNIFSRLAFDISYENSNMGITKEKVLYELNNRNISLTDNSIWEYSVEDLSALKELVHSGKLIENRYATTRLFFK